MNVEEMVIKHSLKPRGVIQVGSHHGEEVPLWDRLRVKQIHYEPIRDNYMALKAKYPEVKVYPLALGEHEDVCHMFTETVNGGQSCSLLRPKKHLEILPWIEFNGKEGVIVERMDSFLFSGEYNFLYIDTQGFELQVLKGGIKTLEQIDFIFTEVNRAEVFEGCAMIEDIDAFLEAHGFKRVETEWHGGEFGDALYVRC